MVPCCPGGEHATSGRGRTRIIAMATIVVRAAIVSVRAWAVGVSPRAVIAGHKRSGKADDPRIIEETRQYIRDFDKLAESSKTARELYDQMLKLYPDWLDPHVLWLGARAAKGEGAP